jgi:hypothetical protein
MRALAAIAALAAAGGVTWLALRNRPGNLSGARRRRRGGGLRGEAEARELHLYCENDGDIYRQRIEPIRRNLHRKLKKGVYNHEKSKKLWMYAVESCAKKYAKEFGSPNQPWHKMFSMADRKEVAKEFADNFKQEFLIEGR